MKSELPDKSFYSIGEVANYLGVKTSTIRYWEKEFSQLSPRKFSGERKYTKEDITIIEQIYYLLKVKKLSIKGAKEELKKKRKKSFLNDYKFIEELKELKRKLIWLKKILSE